MSKIITVGLCPAWDVICRGQRLDWGLHKNIDEQIVRPAGKALNISRALAWMGAESTAAGLWGRQDYEQMQEAMRPLKRLVKVKMTPVDGSTRRNVTVVDTVNNREMHLRHRSVLASPKALRKLKVHLLTIVEPNSVCIFAGSMPESEPWPTRGELLSDVVQIVKLCTDGGAKIALDTSGEALREIVDSGGIWLIKPNVAELSELLGEQVRNHPLSLAKAGRKLLEKCQIVLISRGSKGSVVVTKKGTWQGRCAGDRKVLSTVGCGDYLLAGFLKGMKDKSDVRFALRTATKVATAKAWDWTEQMNWLQVERKMDVQVSRV